MSVYIAYPDIAADAVKRETSHTYDTELKIGNLLYGERYLRAELAAEATGLKRLSFDLGKPDGSDETRSSNYFIIARGDILQTDNHNYVSLRGSACSPFYPSSVSGLTGWWDATRNVTSADTLVSQWDDLSGGDWHFTEGTAANKPILTRWDNQENWWLNSEDMDSQYKYQVTVTTDTVANPISGSVDADKVIPTAVSGEHYCTTTGSFIDWIDGNTYRVSCYAADAGYDYIILYFYGDVSGYFAQVFDVANGTIGNSLGSVSNVTIEASNYGFYRCSFEATATATNLSMGAGFQVSNVDQIWPSFSGDTTSGIYVWGLQTQHEDADSTYLKTTTTQQLAGVNNYQALWFDGTNTRMANTATMGDIATVTDMTWFVVMRPFEGNGNSLNTASVAQITTGYWDNISFQHNDGSWDTVNAAGGVAGTAHIVCAKHTGGNIYVGLDGGAFDSTASGDSTSTAAALWLGDAAGGGHTGYICEVLTYNTAVSDADRTLIEAYLASKWQTTPAFSKYDFMSETLYGPGSGDGSGDDYITTFSDTSAYRHWYIDLDSGTSNSKCKTSKYYFGSYLDLGKGPADISWRRVPQFPSVGKMRSGASSIYRLGSTIYEFSIRWEGISDDNTDLFLNKIVRYADKYRYFLFTTDEHQLLNNERVIHVMLTSHNVSNEAAIADWNTIEATFREIAG